VGAAQGRGLACLGPGSHEACNGEPHSFSGSAGAYKRRPDPVRPVEAGLRTGNLYSPWPEEANRKLTGGITRFHFAPTETSRSNLLREGISDEWITVTGNTVIDALFWVHDLIEADPAQQSALASLFPYLDEKRRLILVTGHRRESFGHGFERICAALKQIAASRRDPFFVPRVRRRRACSVQMVTLLFVFSGESDA